MNTKGTVRPRRFLGYIGLRVMDLSFSRGVSVSNKSTSADPSDL